MRRPVGATSTTLVPTGMGSGGRREWRKGTGGARGQMVDGERSEKDKGKAGRKFLAFDLTVFTRN